MIPNKYMPVRRMLVPTLQVIPFLADLASWRTRRASVFCVMTHLDEIPDARSARHESPTYWNPERSLT